MVKNKVSKRVTATILSMSLLTVMAGAAIAPALGIIKAHFSEADALLVQLIVSMPALLTTRPRPAVMQAGVYLILIQYFLLLSFQLLTIHI